MRILIYNWRDLRHPQAGGAEVYTDAVATAWQDMGHEVTLFTSAVKDAPSEERAGGGYRLIRRGGRHGVYREAKRYWSAEGVGNFDLVIDEVNTRPFGCPRWVRDTPVLGLIHQVCREIWFYETPFPVALLGRYVLEPWWLRQFREIPVITVSESSKASLELYGLRRVTVVPEGHAPSPHRPAKKNDYPVVLYLGRLTANKRPDHAIRAFQLAKKSLPEAKMWVVGDGPMRKKLERMAGDDVMFFGRVPTAERERFLAEATCLVVTSVREGWGLVVTEAAEAGTPAIAYDVPGLRDSVVAARGVLVAPAVNQMAEAMIRQLTQWHPAATPLGSIGTIPWIEVGKRFIPKDVDDELASWNGPTITL